MGRKIYKARRSKGPEVYLGCLALKTGYPVFFFGILTKSRVVPSQIGDLQTI